LLELVGGNGGGVEVALRVVAAEFDEQVRLFDGLDALGGDPEPEVAVTPEPPPAAAPAAPDSEIALAYRRIRGGDVSLFEMKKALERECIVRALEETSGNITRAALLLGMKRPRLSQLVKQYELAADAGDAADVGEA
jgi:DNA-binding NtrC family response regulator